MTSDISINRLAFSKQHRFRVTLAVLVIFYAVGTVGILSSYSEHFVRLTFANLVLTALVLLLNAERFGARAAVGFSVSMVVGFAVEALGVKTGVIFGEYHYTDRMGPRLIEVPLVIGLNWAILVHAVHVWVGGWFRWCHRDDRFRLGDGTRRDPATILGVAGRYGSPQELPGLVGVVLRAATGE
jgi:uncharacterized membrane protein